jgi:hypothetical protein
MSLISDTRYRLHRRRSKIRASAESSRRRSVVAGRRATWRGLEGGQLLAASALTAEESDLVGRTVHHANRLSADTNRRVVVRRSGDRGPEKG